MNPVLLTLRAHGIPTARVADIGEMFWWVGRHAKQLARGMTLEAMGTEQLFGFMRPTTCVWCRMREAVVGQSSCPQCEATKSRRAAARRSALELELGMRSFGDDAYEDSKDSHDEQYAEEHGVWPRRAR